jgi:AraC-like DNA-binding protein
MRIRGRHAKLRRGLEVVERGGNYSEAAGVAGYSDGFQFSRACYLALGCRPRAAMRTDWRNLLDAPLRDAA